MSRRTNRIRPHHWTPLVAGFALLAGTALCHAETTYYVSKAGTDSDGTSWATAFTELTGALAVANSADQIWVAEGTYTPTTGDRQNTFEIPDGVLVYGGFAGDEAGVSERDWRLYPTILSGDIGTAGTATDNCYNVVRPRAGTVLDGFIVQDGYADHASDTSRKSGGGAYIFGITATIRNCVFRGNYAAQNGGAIYNSFSSTLLTLERTVFYDNTGGLNGGGLYTAGGSITTALNCVFADNTADYGGGGVYTGAATSITMTNCTWL